MADEKRKERKSDEQSDSYERFEDLTRKLLKVPKEEVDKEREKRDREKRAG